MKMCIERKNGILVGEFTNKYNEDWEVRRYGDNLYLGGSDVEWDFKPLRNDRFPWILDKDEINGISNILVNNYSLKEVARLTSQF